MIWQTLPHAPNGPPERHYNRKSSGHLWDPQLHISSPVTSLIPRTIVQRDWFYLSNPDLQVNTNPEEHYFFSYDCKMSLLSQKKGRGLGVKATHHLGMQSVLWLWKKTDLKLPKDDAKINLLLPFCTQQQPVPPMRASNFPRAEKRAAGKAEAAPFQAVLLQGSEEPLSSGSSWDNSAMLLRLSFWRAVLLTEGSDGVTGLAAWTGTMRIHSPHSKLVVGIWIEALDNHGVHLDPLLD